MKKECPSTSQIKQEFTSRNLKNISEKEKERIANKNEQATGANMEVKRSFENEYIEDSITPKKVINQYIKTCESNTQIMSTLSPDTIESNLL